jgi:hypothetical protein
MHPRHDRGDLALCVAEAATHGLLDSRDWMRSCLLLAPEPEASEEDGVLEAREIAGMALSARLAVLSACESGRGQPGGGEGLVKPATSCTHTRRAQRRATARGGCRSHRVPRSLQGRAPVASMETSCLRGSPVKTSAVSHRALNQHVRGTVLSEWLLRPPERGIRKDRIEPQSDALPATSLTSRWCGVYPRMTYIGQIGLLASYEISQPTRERSASCRNRQPRSAQVRSPVTQVGVCRQTRTTVALIGGSPSGAR